MHRMLFKFSPQTRSTAWKFMDSGRGKGKLTKTTEKEGFRKNKGQFPKSLFVFSSKSTPTRCYLDTCWKVHETSWISESTQFQADYSHILLRNQRISRYNDVGWTMNMTNPERVHDWRGGRAISAAIDGRRSRRVWQRWIIQTMLS